MPLSASSSADDARQAAVRLMLHGWGDWAGEGLWSAPRPGDPNPTMRGITLRTLQGLGSAGDLDGDGDVDVQDLLRVDDTFAGAIYAGLYWQPVAAVADVAPRLAVAVFDGAVQHGPAQAVKLLQRAVGANPDGVVGRLTVGFLRHALLAHGELGVVARYLGTRIQFYEAIMLATPALQSNRRGWQARVNAVAAFLGLPNMWHDGPPGRAA
jgi:lysozyme family protein